VKLKPEKMAALLGAYQQQFFSALLSIRYRQVLGLSGTCAAREVLISEALITTGQLP
jgi:hypothetical protein